MSLAPQAILGFTDQCGEASSLIFTDPVDVLVAHRAADVRPLLLRVARAAAEEGLYAVGFVAYEAAPALDPHLVTRAPGALPLAWFALHRAPALVDDAALSSGSDDVALADWTPSASRAAHAAAVAEVRARIARGDVYQVNHTFRLRARFRGDAVALYRRLRAAQRAAYCAYLDLGRHRLISASPELFFRLRGRAIETRPMKGTAPRGRWREEDAVHAAALAASAKNRAENVMIVDLLRNDLGRLAEPGSVEVPRLFEVERYPTMLQMTSTITATLRPETSLAEIFGALFPCGSVTGAPKYSAMQCIAALEDAPRGAYCGAIGLVRPGGDCTFNVAIRTLALDTETGEIEYGVGGGITWDSAAADEYDEALLKARVLGEAEAPFELLETLRLEEGTLVRLERHLARLADSARYFGFAAPEDAARAALAALARETPVGRHRVRVCATADGTVRVECTAAPDGGAPDAPRPVALARTPVSSADRFLYHKTTRRALYDAHRAEHPEAWDVLLRNERGELTEFTIGNVVVELDGARWTPPRACGLLAGVFRAELLERGVVRERVLGVPELARVTRAWLVNSLREWVPVRIAAGAAAAG